jgi:hypothetical protein
VTSIAVYVVSTLLQVCLSCGLKSLNGTVTCLPGTYSLTYSVTNDDGATATATRAVIIYSAGRLSLQLPLYQDLDNGTAAGVTVQALGNATSLEAAAAANSIASRISSSSEAGLDVLPSDVHILDAQLVELGPSNFSVHVSAVVYVYSPASVHHGDIISSTGAGSGVAINRTRRASLSSTRSSLAASTAALHLQSTSTAAAASNTRVQEHQASIFQDAVDANVYIMISTLKKLAATVTAEAQAVQHAALTNKHTTCSTAADCSTPTRIGRQLLQAADSGIAAQLASMTAAATNSLGPVSMSGQQTSASVDPAVVSVPGMHSEHHSGLALARMEWWQDYACFWRVGRISMSGFVCSQIPPLDAVFDQLSAYVCVVPQWFAAMHCCRATLPP